MAKNLSPFLLFFLFYHFFFILKKSKPPPIFTPTLTFFFPNKPTNISKNLSDLIAHQNFPFSACCTAQLSNWSIFSPNIFILCSFPSLILFPQIIFFHCFAKGYMSTGLPAAVFLVRL